MTRNWPSYNEAPKHADDLVRPRHDSGEAAPTGKRGRQPDYSDAAIQTCLTMKVLFGMALTRNEILRTSRRVGRTIWRRWSRYHRRRRVETKMHCVKHLVPTLERKRL